MNSHASSKRRDSFDAVPTRRSSSRCQDAEQILLGPELDRSRHTAAAERAKLRRQKEAAERMEAERREAEVLQAELREAQRREAERRENQRREAEKRDAQWREEEARRLARKRRMGREARQQELERKDAERHQAERIDLERGENDKRQQIIQSILKLQDMISEFRMETLPTKSKSWARYRSEDELVSYLKHQCATLVDTLQESS